MYDKIYGFVQSVDNIVWGWAMILLLLGTHLFLTVRTGFIQRKTITKGIPLSVSKEEGADGEVSRDRPRRTGSRALVLADRSIRNRDKICGVPDRCKIPREDGRRAHAGGRDVCAGPGA